MFRNLSCLCVAVLLAASARAEENIYLVGWMGLFDGTSRIIIRVLPENRDWILYSDDAVADWRLLQLDVPHKRALIMHGTNVLMARFLSSDQNKDQLATFVRTGILPPDYVGQWPAGYEPEIIRFHRAGMLAANTNSEPIQTGQKASGQYVGALRAYAKTLPEAEAAPILRELEKYSAGSVSDETPTSKPTPNSMPLPDASYPATQTQNSQNSPSLLERVLNSPPPEVGTLIGTGTDGQVPELRRLLRSQNDPGIILRLQHQLEGYASPPIANYVRDASGQWSDSPANRH